MLWRERISALSLKFQIIPPQKYRTPSLLTFTVIHISLTIQLLSQVTFFVDNGRYFAPWKNGKRAQMPHLVQFIVYIFFSISFKILILYNLNVSFSFWSMFTAWVCSILLFHLHVIMYFASKWSPWQNVYLCFFLLGIWIIWFSLFRSLCIQTGMKSGSNCPVCKVPFHRRGLFFFPTALSNFGILGFEFIEAFVLQSIKLPKNWRLCTLL